MTPLWLRLLFIGHFSMVDARSVAKYHNDNMESGVKPPHSKSAVSRKRQSQQPVQEGGTAGDGFVMGVPVGGFRQREAVVEEQRDANPREMAGPIEATLLLRHAVRMQHQVDGVGQCAGLLEFVHVGGCRKILLSGGQDERAVLCR